MLSKSELSIINGKKKQYKMYLWRELSIVDFSGNSR